MPTSREWWEDKNVSKNCFKSITMNPYLLGMNYFYLDLSDQQLTEVEYIINIIRPDFIKGINLSNNPIESIDSSVLVPFKLRELNLSFTKVKSVDLKQLSDLDSLNLAHTEVTSVDLTHMKAHFLYLNLSYTEVKSVDLRGRTYLEYLNLSGTRIKELDLSSCPFLMNLNVSDCKIKNLDLRDCVLLETLNITGCNELETVLLPPEMERELERELLQITLQGRALLAIPEAERRNPQRHLEGISQRIKVRQNELHELRLREKEIFKRYSDWRRTGAERIDDTEDILKTVQGTIADKQHRLNALIREYEVIREDPEEFYENLWRDAINSALRKMTGSPQVALQILPQDRSRDRGGPDLDR